MWEKRMGFSLYSCYCFVYIQMPWMDSLIQNYRMNEKTVNNWRALFEMVNMSIVFRQYILPSPGSLSLLIQFWIVCNVEIDGERTNEEIEEVEWKVNGSQHAHTGRKERFFLSMKLSRFLSGVVAHTKKFLYGQRILIQNLWRNHMGKLLDSDSQKLESNNNGLYNIYFFYSPLFAVIHIFEYCYLTRHIFHRTFTRDIVCLLFHDSAVVFCLSPCYSKFVR